MKKINALLREMEKTLFNKDYVMLADLLGYELKEMLSNYLEIIKRDISL